MDDEFEPRDVRYDLHTVLGTRFLRMMPSQAPLPPGVKSSGEDVLFVIDLVRDDGLTETIVMRKRDWHRLLANIIKSLEQLGDPVGVAFQKFGEETFGPNTPPE